MRRVVLARVVAVAMLLAAGCGDDGEGVAEVSRPVPEGAATSTPVMGGPGLLEMLERDTGRVEIVSTSSGGDTWIAEGTADFHDGGRIMQFDRDPALDQILADYRPLLAERSRRFDVPAARPELPEGDPTVQSAALADLLAAILVPRPSPLGQADDACVAEVADVRADLLAEPPEAVWTPAGDGREEWVLEAVDVVELPPCVGEEIDVGNVRVRFVRDLDEGHLELSVDPDIYVTPRFDPVAAFRVVDDTPAIGRPDEPSTTVVDQASVFLLAVNRCGELPWAYSNFMSGNRYTSPDEDDYVEPGIFTSGYLCRDEVPDR